MLTWHGKRFGLIMALVLALPTPAAAIYGGSPVPSAKGGGGGLLHRPRRQDERQL